MTFLQRVLKVQAAVWAAFGLVLATVPGTLLRALDQPLPADEAWLRLAGIMALVLAMMMWLVAQHAAETWWWAWAFAVLEAGVATVSVLNAVLGTAEGAAAWPWWLFGLISIAFGALDLLGMAKAEQAKPFV